MTESMKKVYDKAQLLNVTEHELLLKEYGLHNVDVGVAESSNYRMCFGHLKTPTFTRHCLGIACMHTMVDFSEITFWLS